MAGANFESKFAGSAWLRISRKFEMVDSRSSFEMSLRIFVILSIKKSQKTTESESLGTFEGQSEGLFQFSKLLVRLKSFFLVALTT